MSAYSKRADLLSQKLKNCVVIVKATNNGHPLNGNKVFCNAVFFCKDKWLRKILQRRTRAIRNYQICKLQDRCNQQSDTPVYWEV